MSDQWGPRPGGPQVSPPAHTSKRPHGCLIALMGYFAVSACTAGFAGLGSVETIPVSFIGFAILAGIVIWFRSWMSAPAREREQAEREQQARQAEIQEWRRTRPAVVIAQAADPLEAARAATLRRDGCAFLGVDANDEEWVVADRQQAVLVLGPPRSGKTSSLIIPSVLSASGPVVSTSTKAEVLRATGAARSRLGRVWLFDPSGTEVAPAGVLELHWSPIWQSRTWDGARAIADAMVGASSAGAGVENANFWTESAKSLLAPLLHAAAVDGQTISDVRRWISRRDVAPAGNILEAAGAESAADDLDAVWGTEERERAAIFSSARVVLSAYGSDEAAKRSRRQNFDADKFVRSGDTVYVTAPSHLQSVLAPLVAGLLEEIKDATYRLARDPEYSARRYHPVMWALDEVANIAPLKNLPSIVSEAGGQGLQIMACLQDLSQAKNRWGTAAEGFLSLFGTKVVFPGIGDRATLESLSMMVGDWDRPYTVYNTNTGHSVNYGTLGGSRSTGEGWTYSTQRESQVSPSEIANIPPGHALLVRSGHWSLVKTIPFHNGQPWQSALSKAPTAVENQGDADTLHFGDPDGDSVRVPSDVDA